MIAERAREEARAAGSPTLEAEHILLAIASGPGTAAQQVLASAGLDHEAIGEALEAEFADSLIGVGVSLGAFDLRQPANDPARTPRWSQSAKLVFQRAAEAVAANRDRRLEATHLLLGVLRAQIGTVPRALELAGVDRAALTARAEQALHAS
ncbi:MAG: Clp protease N-terminal domain-containing protein [Candidatus Limnocylindrales bacterium]